MQLKQGLTLNEGKYEIVEILGQGELGITYLALQKNETTTSKVVIKEFFMKYFSKRDPNTFCVFPLLEEDKLLIRGYVTKFVSDAERECRSQKDVNIKVCDVFEENNTAYYVVNYIEGELYADRYNEPEAQKGQDFFASFIDMVQVEGGAFQMGSFTKEAGIKNQTIHTVTLSSFSIGKYPVTYRQWMSVMGELQSNIIGLDRPVNKVSWLECVEFCNVLSRLAGLEECYSINGKDVLMDMSKNGFRLPTEAEWEFAARGGLKSKGYKYSGGDMASDVAIFCARSYGASRKVGLMQANELGIYDMSGNVEEWCWDFWGEYSSDSQINPTGAETESELGSLRVIRGGCFYDEAKRCRSTQRSGCTDFIKSDCIGFRLVRRYIGEC